MFEGMSNNEKVAIAVVGIILLGAVVDSAPWLLLLFLIAGFVYFSRTNESDQSYIRQQPESWEIERENPQPRPVRRERPSTAEQIHQHALRAVRRAGLDPNAVPVLTTDLGLITFHNDADPALHRASSVPDDADYIQPFVELRVPVTAMGKVRFEIYDGGPQPVFVHEEMHQLKRGRNLISPASRLPVHDELSTTRNWELRIIADNVVVARHVFRWDDTAGEDTPAGGENDNALNDHIGEDGEISHELRAIMAESRLGRMSLDELLSDQDPDDAQQQARR